MCGRLVPTQARIKVSVLFLSIKVMRRWWSFNSSYKSSRPYNSIVYLYYYMQNVVAVVS